MKNQALFSSKDKSKKLKCRLLQFLFSPLIVKKIKPSIWSMPRRHGLAKTFRIPGRIML